MKYNRIALVFPGQGSEYVGMGKELHNKFKFFRDIFNRASKIVGYDISKTCFQKSSFYKRLLHRRELNRTKYADPAILTMSYGCFKVLENACEQRNVDLNVSFLAGHDVGEYTAFLISGVMDFRTCLSLVHKRATCMTEFFKAHHGGGLIAISDKDREINYEKIKSLCENAGVHVASVNTKSRIVAGGPKSELKKLSKKLRKQGKLTKMLKAEGPFNTPMMKPAANKFIREVDKIDLRIASIPIIVNAKKEAIADPIHVREEIFDQICSTVYWRYSVEKAIGDGCDLFIEIGPERILSRMIEDIDSSIPKLNVEDVQSLEKAVGTLAG